MFVSQAQINVRANRRIGNRPPSHAENDNSSSANSSTVANTTSSAPSAPLDSGASTAQTETAGSNTNQTQDAPQTQSERPQVSSQGELEGTRSMYSTHRMSVWIGILNWRLPHLLLVKKGSGIPQFLQYWYSKKKNCRG
jgi:hypothetical protein